MKASGAEAAALPARSVAWTVTVAAVDGGSAPSGMPTSKLVAPAPAGRVELDTTGLDDDGSAAGSSVAKLTSRHGPAEAAATPDRTGGVTSGASASSNTPIVPAATAAPLASAAPAAIETAQEVLGGRLPARCDTVASAAPSVGAGRLDGRRGRHRRALPVAHNEAARPPADGRRKADHDARQIERYPGRAGGRIDQRGARRARWASAGSRRSPARW